MTSDWKNDKQWKSYGNRFVKCLQLQISLNQFTLNFEVNALIQTRTNGLRIESLNSFESHK